MLTITIKTEANWQLYWGVAPLPAHAVAIGTVEIERGAHYYRRGALIRLASGVYVQGNSGAIRSLPQADIVAALPNDAHIGLRDPNPIP